VNQAYYLSGAGLRKKMVRMKVKGMLNKSCDPVATYQDRCHGLCCLLMKRMAITKEVE